MAAAKNATAAKEAAKPVKEYKVTGKGFKSKSEANTELKKVFEKGFKSAGLMVQGSEFVILFGTYTTAQIAKANAAAVEKAGFTATVTE